MLIILEYQYEFGSYMHVDAYIVYKIQFMNRDMIKQIYVWAQILVWLNTQAPWYILNEQAWAY